MRVLIATDSFKGSLTSLQVANLIRNGILRVYPKAETEIVPIADGGEGTVESIVKSVGGRYRTVEVHGPLWDIVNARYGIIKDHTAVIEMAESSGLILVPKGKKNPLVTTTYGFGEQIKDALDQGCKSIIVGIGGSATNDGGVGMAAALGAKFLDKGGKEVDWNGGSLNKIEKVDLSGFDKRIKETEIIVASDVSNPLCGKRGASRVYGPQKGATSEMVEILDRNLRHFSEIIRRELKIDILDTPGAGAAGGVGAALMSFCGARLEKGIELILDLIELDRRIEKTDIVITGEGRIDGQSVFGKVPVGVAKMAKKYGKPVFAVCGFIGENACKVYEYGIDAIMSAIVSPVSLEEAIKESSKNIEDASERLFRIIRAVVK
jgi:glycerate 2-kinase